MEHLAFCQAHYLPVNDVWLFARSKAAAAAAAALDDAAHCALPTASALQALDGVVQQHARDAVRIRGTYPHSQWQGSRIEGFVVSQGSQVSVSISSLRLFVTFFELPAVTESELLKCVWCCLGIRCIHVMHVQITDKTHSDLNNLSRSFQNMFLNCITESSTKEASKKSKGAEDCFAEGTMGRVGIAGGADMGGSGGITAEMLTRLRKEVASVAPDASPLLVCAP